MAVLATWSPPSPTGPTHCAPNSCRPDLRRVLVDELARRYYQQAKAAAQGACRWRPRPAGSPGQAAGMGGSRRRQPLTALSSLSSAPTSALSSLSSPASSLLNSASSPLQQLPPWAAAPHHRRTAPPAFSNAPPKALPRGLANERGTAAPNHPGRQAISAASLNFRDHAAGAATP